MKFHDFSPFYRSGEGIRSKVSGDRLIDNPAVADAQGGSGASYSFDGTDDVVTGPTSTLYDNAFASGGTISAWVNPSSLGENVTGRIAQKGDQGGANGGWLLCCLAQSGNNISLRFQHLWSTGDVYADSGYSLPIGQWTHVAVHYDGSSPSNTATFYFNGVADVGTNTNSGSGTVATDDSTPLYIGDRSTSDKSWDGQISQVRLHNRALSADEVRAAYNGQAVGFEHRGASQDALITGDDSDFDTVGNWISIGSSTVDGGYGGGVGHATTLRIQAGDASGEGAAIPNLTLTHGKAYRFIVDYKTIEGTNLTDYEIWLYDTVSGDTVVMAEPLKSLGSWVEGYTAEAIWTGPSTTTGRVYFKAPGSEGHADNETLLDNATLTQIGCVAEYLPSGINATQWVDTSGNNLHGSTSTATAVNHTTGALTMVDNIVMADGKGIDFSATADGTGASSVAEVLSDYEEGTWTPVLSDASSAGNLAGVTVAEASYTKIGRLVTVETAFQITSVSGMTTGDPLYIQGLPFPSRAGDDDYRSHGIVGYFSGISFDSGFTWIATRIEGDEISYLVFQEAGSGVASNKILVSQIVGTPYIQLSHTYQA